MESKPKYSARAGSGMTNKQAQIVGKTLEEMKEKRIRRTPSKLLELATDKRSPLHSLFDWDDASAAHTARLIRARELISGVQIINYTVQTYSKAFHSVVSYEVQDGKQALNHNYEERDVVLRSPSKLNQVSSALFQRLQPIIREAQSLNLTTHDRAWRAIVEAVKTNIPKSVKTTE